MDAPDIFISYRREDEPAFAGRVFDLLKVTFPRHTPFMDVDGIQPGTSFLEHIVSQIESCSVFLPVIGLRWLYLGAASGSSRLFDADDLVRREIEVALDSTCTIMPVLVDNARMPPPHALPQSIARLSSLNAVRLTHARFHNDAQPLIKAIKRFIKHPIE